MMKKIILFFILLLVMAIPATAINLVRVFTSVNDDVELPEQTIELDCTGTIMFEDELVSINKMFVFQEIIKSFDSGAHIFELEHSYRGSEYYTVNIEDDRILSVESGVCSSDYKLYELSIDLNLVEEKLSNGDNDVFIELYKVIKDIKGMNIIHKLKIIKALVVYGVKDIQIIPGG